MGYQELKESSGSVGVEKLSQKVIVIKALFSKLLASRVGLSTIIYSGLNTCSIYLYKTIIQKH